MKRVINVGRGDELHTLEHFDTALRLFSFGGFSAKTVDVALQMRDAQLLALIHRLLLRKTGRALHFK